MTWSHQIDTWIVVTGALAAMACALPGTFLVLRRMSLMGDAISHAVLPGLAIAFLLTHSRDSWIMFVGAASIGVLTAAFTQWVSRLGRVDESASMGVVFSCLFAIGLVLIVAAAHHVDLDAGCVLYGSIETVTMDRWTVLGWSIPRAACILGGVFLINVLLTLAFFKELRITSFDPGLATAQGIPAWLMHYGLMAVVAVTCVAAFESVGSILVIAMLILPAATANLLTDRLPIMLVLATLLGGLTAVLGHLAALTLPPLVGFRDASTAGMIAVMAGVLFGAAALLSPRHGVIARAIGEAALRARILREDVLGLLFRCDEDGRTEVPFAELGPRLIARVAVVRRAIGRLVRDGAIVVNGTALSLTPRGRDAARELIRSHRLWETYFERELGLPPDHTHAPAERLEHLADAAVRRRLAEETAHAALDPHGKAIPREG
jgi:manganese/zinc/iron transport system permease protein